MLLIELSQLEFVDPDLSQILWLVNYDMTQLFESHTWAKNLTRVTQISNLTQKFVVWELKPKRTKAPSIPSRTHPSHLIPGQITGGIARGCAKGDRSFLGLTEGKLFIL